MREININKWFSLLFLVKKGMLFNYEIQAQIGQITIAFLSKKGEQLFGILTPCRSPSFPKKFHMWLLVGPRPFLICSIPKQGIAHKFYYEPRVELELEPDSNPSPRRERCEAHKQHAEITCLKFVTPLVKNEKYKKNRRRKDLAEFRWTWSRTWPRDFQHSASSIQSLQQLQAAIARHPVTGGDLVCSWFYQPQNIYSSVSVTWPSRRRLRWRRLDESTAGAALKLRPMDHPGRWKMKNRQPKREIKRRSRNSPKRSSSPSRTLSI